MIRKIIEHPLLQRIYFQRTGTGQTLVVSIVFSTLLVFFRVIYTGHTLFLFLIWNLFLAFIPFAITRFLMANPKWIEQGHRFWTAFIVWLLFIPNAFYILTDLFHLESRTDVPLWFDLALLVSFAWNGLLLGIVSVRQMEQIAEAKFAKRYSSLLLLPLMMLNALGIYIGRYLRYNSWDVITNPFQLMQDMSYLCLHPLRNRFDWSMIVCFSFLLMLMYTSIKKLSKEIW